jgi:hypothetical protein
VLRLGLKQRNKTSRNRNSDCWPCSIPKPKHAYCFAKSPCCTFSIWECVLLHLQQLLHLQHGQTNCCTVSIQVPIAAFASRSDCFARIAAFQIALLRLCHLLHLQHPSPPNYLCCICNIIVRRVMVWGYRLLI